MIEVIKIGGNIIDAPETLKEFLDNFSTYDGLKVLIHGGGKKASSLSRSMGITPVMREGRRITDAQTLEIVTMVYAGLINKNIVAALQARKINSLGLTGADLNIIPAWKRANSEIDYGFVGDFDPEDINAKQLFKLLEDQITPVFCALTHDCEGTLLNTNADTLAAGIAISLARHHHVRLHLCFEKPGVLTDIDDDNSVIPELTMHSYQSLKEEGKIFEGMIPKLDNAFNALEKGVSEIHIRHALAPLESGTKLHLHE